MNIKVVLALAASIAICGCIGNKSTSLAEGGEAPQEGASEKMRSTSESAEMPGIAIHKVFGVDESLVQKALADLDGDAWFHETVEVKLNNPFGPFESVSFSVRRSSTSERKGTNWVRKVNCRCEDVSFSKRFEDSLSYEEYRQKFAEAVGTLGDMLGASLPIPEGDPVLLEKTCRRVSRFEQYGESPVLRMSVELGKGQRVSLHGREPVFVKRHGEPVLLATASLSLEIHLPEGREALSARFLNLANDKPSDKKSVQMIDIGEDLSKQFLDALREKRESQSRFSGNRRIVSRFEKSPTAKSDGSK